MHLLLLPLLSLGLSFTTPTTAALTYTLEQSPSPTEDQSSAYTLIQSIMDAAIARHSRLGSATKSLYVRYVPGVPTAEANYDGTISFGSNRAYMTERTALHEISHTLGVGQTAAFEANCEQGDWPSANALVAGWDGAGTEIQCGGGHFWPYGLNYESEWSETNGERNVLVVNAMLEDGM